MRIQGVVDLVAYIRIESGRMPIRQARTLARSLALLASPPPPPLSLSLALLMSLLLHLVIVVQPKAHQRYYVASSLHQRHRLPKEQHS